jgi:hypothetical protein
LAIACVANTASQLEREAEGTILVSDILIRDFGASQEETTSSSLLTVDLRHSKTDVREKGEGEDKLRSFVTRKMERRSKSFGDSNFNSQA